MGQEAAVVGLGFHLAGQLLDMLTKRETALQVRREIKDGGVQSLSFACWLINSINSTGLYKNICKLSKMLR